MNILVTGANGYIGSSFITRYSQQYTFKKFSLRQNHIEEIDFKNISTILHCAALVHQRKYKDLDEYLDVNVRYPLNLAKKAKERGVKQFIFLSSVAVYGESHGYVNEGTPCEPVTNYGKSKLIAEQELMQLNNNDFIVTVIRLPMVYGKDAPGNIKSLIKLVRTLPSLPLGGIKNRRSFIYIGNLCRFIERVIEKKQAGILLISDNESISTTELIEYIASALDKELYLFSIPFVESIVKTVIPSTYNKLYSDFIIDCTNTKNIMDYSNKFSVQEGIKLSI